MPPCAAVDELSLGLLPKDLPATKEGEALALDRGMFPCVRGRSNFDNLPTFQTLEHSQSYHGDWGIGPSNAATLRIFLLDLGVIGAMILVHKHIMIHTSIHLHICKTSKAACVYPQSC